LEKAEQKKIEEQFQKEKLAAVRSVENSSKRLCIDVFNQKNPK
jgi:hypothetical protein